MTGRPFLPEVLAGSVEARHAAVSLRHRLLTVTFAGGGFSGIEGFGELLSRRGIFQWRGIVIKGFPAWLMHRGYHVHAAPSWERKLRVLAIRLTAAVFGRDIVSLASVQHPRQAFTTDDPPVPAGTAMRHDCNT